MKKKYLFITLFLVLAAAVSVLLLTRQARTIRHITSEIQQTSARFALSEGLKDLNLSRLEATSSTFAAAGFYDIKDPLFEAYSDQLITADDTNAVRYGFSLLCYAEKEENRTAPLLAIQFRYIPDQASIREEWRPYLFVYHSRTYLPYVNNLILRVNPSFFGSALDQILVSLERKNMDRPVREGIFGFDPFTDK